MACVVRTTLRLLLGLHALCTSSEATAAGTGPGCRDRFLEPFSSTSIWNTAIGSDAKVRQADCPMLSASLSLYLSTISTAATCG